MTGLEDLSHWWDEYYGVQLFDHEDDWGWTILGWPEERRVVAAISALARDRGVQYDLRDELRHVDLEIQRKVAVNFREGPEGEYRWDWAEPEFLKAGAPMTVVTF